jgi:heme oxygenase (mycobilin-producing)
MQAPTTNQTNRGEQRQEAAHPRSNAISTVVLINAFEVPAGEDETFLQGWEAARDFMQRQHGYVSTRLHQSLDPTARFRFINVAEWATPADFQAALNHPEFVAMRQAIPFAHYPSLYQVVRA